MKSIWSSWKEIRQNFSIKKINYIQWRILIQWFFSATWIGELDFYMIFIALVLPINDPSGTCEGHWNFSRSKSYVDPEGAQRVQPRPGPKLPDPAQPCSSASTSEAAFHTFFALLSLGSNMILHCALYLLSPSPYHSKGDLCLFSRNVWGSPSFTVGCCICSL